MILERVRCATEEARKSGWQKFERDGTILESADPPYPLLMALLRVATATRGRLRIFDFGGSLGSSYRQCRAYLESVGTLRWIVVEQPNFVALGKDYMDGVLAFAGTLGEAASNETPDVILFSSVLQYLEAPLDTIRKAIEIGPRSIIIDRTPTIRLPESRIAIQRVPRRMGGSSYPVWLFNRERLLEPFSDRYGIVDEFAAVDGVMSYRSRRVEFKGFVLDRLPAQPRWQE